MPRDAKVTPLCRFPERPCRCHSEEHGHARRSPRRRRGRVVKRPPVMRRRRGELSTERAARQLNYFDRNLASPAAENPVNREMWERQREAALAYLAVRHACTRCGRAHLKTEYEVNGRVYGSECVQHVRQVAS